MPDDPKHKGELEWEQELHIQENGCWHIQSLKAESENLSDTLYLLTSL